MFFCRKKQTANKDKIVFLSKQFILCLFQFENCVFRSESVAKSDKLSYNEKRKRGIFLLLFWRRSSKVRIGVYFMKEKEKTKVVLADRDGFYLQRLKRCLERRGDMTVVGMADNGVALLDLVIQKKPAVLLTDILLGERDGLWVLENIKKRGLPCICIFISAIDSDAAGNQPWCGVLYGEANSGGASAGAHPSDAEAGNANKGSSKTESSGAERKSFRGAGKRNFHFAQSHGNLCQHKGVSLYSQSGDDGSGKSGRAGRHYEGAVSRYCQAV